MSLSFKAMPRDADELLAVMRQLGLRSIDRCRLTRNRNVMVSFGDGELRIHRGYLVAPDDVLTAIVRFVECRTRRERASARRILLSFPIDTGATSRRRREASHPDDAPMAARLTACHADYNARFFASQLRPLQVRVSRRMRRHLGHYCAATKAGDPAEIAISRRHVRRHGWGEALQTLLHEMVHQWQDEQGMALDHGRSFKAKAREVGIPPSARRTEAA